MLSKVHDGIIGAVEKINLLPAEVLKGIDLASRRFCVCLRNEVADFQVRRRSFHARTRGSPNGTPVPGDSVVSVSPGAPVRPACNHADSPDDRGQAVPN